MTSLYGVYQYFDYDSWQRERCQPRLTTTFHYPPGTMMSVMMERFPRNAQLIIIAKYDRRFADPLGRFTYFMDPRYETLDAAAIEQLGIHQAKMIVINNTIQGKIRKMDLMTSQDSLLNTIEGTSIHVWYDIRDDRLKKANQWIGEEIMCSNGNVFKLC